MYALNRHDLTLKQPTKNDVKANSVVVYSKTQLFKVPLKQ